MSTLKTNTLEPTAGGANVPVDKIIHITGVPAIGTVPVWTGAAWVPMAGSTAPSGTAGGVLAGSYPNPDFAEPMATDAELAAAIATRAPTVHTHSLSQITQSGATPGQTPVWNGSAWALAGPMATTTELTAAIATRAPTVHTHSLSQITQSGAANGDVPAWNGSAWVPSPQTGGGVSQAVFNSAIGALALSLQSKAPVSTLQNYQPKIVSGANLGTGTQSLAAATKTYIHYDGSNIISSDSDWITVTKSGFETRINIIVPAGKRVWWRITNAQLFDQSSGTNNGIVLGIEQRRTSTGVVEGDAQIGAAISPSTNYAVVPTGEFVGIANYPITIVPWAWSLSTSRMASTAGLGIGCHFALEITHVGDL